MCSAKVCVQILGPTTLTFVEGQQYKNSKLVSKQCPFLDSKAQPDAGVKIVHVVVCII